MTQTFNKDFYNHEYFEGSSKSGYGGMYEQIECGEKPDRIANFIRTNFSGPVLDIGCGFGHLVAALTRAGLDAKGIDISEYSVSKPAKGAEGKVSVADVTKGLPFSDKQFKTVVSYQTLEHIPLEHIPTTVREICRVSDQYVSVEVPTWYNDDSPDRTHTFDKSHISFYSSSFWISEFHKNGFILDLNLSHKLMGTDSSRLIFYKHDNVPARLVEGFKVTPVASEADLRLKWEDHYGHYEPHVTVGESPLKILVVSTSVFRVPLKGYGGLEQLAFQWSVEFGKRGHKVSLVAPEGSKLPDGVELIPMPLMEPEEQTFNRYKDRLAEFDAIMDNTWLWYTVIAQLNSQKQLPVIRIYHSDPDYLQVPRPPIQYPCVVGLSRDHADRLAKKWGMQTRMVYNGISLDYYTPDYNVQRNGRYLWLARYTPEKCPLEAIRAIKRCGAELDLYGNTMIVRDQNYINQCMVECDAHKVVFHNEATREETLGHYRTHKALIHLVDYNEAFGLVPVEAMACGTPVLVNKRGALPELVEDGISGYLVDDWNQVEHLIKTDAVSMIKPENCCSQASKFSIEKSAEGYLSLFRGIVGGELW